LNGPGPDAVIVAPCRSLLDALFTDAANPAMTWGWHMRPSGQPSAVKYRLVQPLQRYVINPPVLLAWRLGLGPPGDALLETTGRHTGRPHHTPVCDGSQGETFWLIAQHGRRADYVRNIEAHPRVKVRTAPHGDWRAGTARVLHDDDPRQRLQTLGQGDLWRRLCLAASRTMGTNLLTVRIDLDPR
jgi:deazaflavin-dependent oxidoreductase (nitroreductase family)